MSDRPFPQTFGGAILVAVIAGVFVMPIDRATARKTEVSPSVDVGKSNALVRPKESIRTQPQQAPLVIHSPSPPPDVTRSDAQPETRKMGTFSTSKQHAEDCARYYTEHGLLRCGCPIPEDFRSARPELAKAMECAWLFATRHSWTTACTSSPPVGLEADPGKALGCAAYLATYYRSAPGCLTVVTLEQRLQRAREALAAARGFVVSPIGDTTAPATK